MLPGGRRCPAPRAGLQIDWSDPDTLTGLLGGILGLGVGIGAPLFYISRDRADEKKLEELRELNRQTFKETGQYLTEVICLGSSFEHRRNLQDIHRPRPARAWPESLKVEVSCAS